MTKVLCSDFGIQCDFVAKGETADVAIRKMKNHMTHEHPKYAEEKLNGKSDDEIKEMVKDKAHEEVAS